MAHTVQLGNMNKKVNSTKTLFSVLITAECNLKEPCDILNPVFTLQPLTGVNQALLNYMYVADFRRRYWITEISFVMGHWEITGKVDVLATYINDIGTQGFFISRAAAAPTSNIPDPYAVTMAYPTVTSFAEPPGYSESGSYIVCCAGAAGNKFYMLSEDSWRRLYASVFSSGFLNDYVDIWDQIVQELNNILFKPEDYIITAKWVPVGVQGSAEQISLGYTNTGITGYALSPGAAIYSKTVEWTIPVHPQAPTYGGFLNSSLYRKISLALPGYGNIIIDSDIASQAPKLRVNAIMDVTGIVTYSVTLLNFDDFVLWRTYVATDLSTEAGFSTTRSGLSNAVASVGTGAASGGLAGAIVGAGSSLLSMAPQVERACAGGSRSVLAGGGPYMLTVTCYNIKPADAVRMGRPYCQVASPAQIPGYIKCEGASVQCDGTQVEIEEINSFLNGGFIYE